METHKSWGMVVLAGLFAVTAIGVASMTYFSESTDNPITVTSVATSEDGRDDTDKDGLPNWQEALLGTDSTKIDTDGDGASDTDEVTKGTNPTAWGTATDTNDDPNKLSTTETLARDLYVEYAKLAEKGTFTADERDQVFAEVIKRDITPPDLTQSLVLSDIKIKADTTVDTYTALVTVILRESTRVKEYELATFARAVNENNFSGTPALKDAATLYAYIAKALLEVEVPPELASEHLATVKSVGALAYAVSLMGNWKGDPLDALSYMDAFNRAEADVTKNVEALFASAAALLKKT